MGLHRIKGTSAPSSTPTDPGQHYIDTVNKKAYISVGTDSSSDWLQQGVGSGDLLSTNNLSDLANPATARTNLGLDSAATQPSSAFDAAGSASVAASAAQSAAETYAYNLVQNLINSSPSTLDTLAEIATALGNDPNFATTITDALANRLRVDTDAQGLNTTQKTNAKTNLDLQNVSNTSDINKVIAGDVTGTLGASTVSKLLNRTLDTGAPTDGQLLGWNATLSKIVWKSLSGSPITKVTSSNSNYQISSVVGGMLAFTGDVAGQVVTMPDAQTLTSGFFPYMIYNDSESFVRVNDYLGNLIYFMFPHDTAYIIPLKNDTQAGYWLPAAGAPSLKDYSKLDDFYQGETTSGSVGEQGWRFNSQNGTGLIAYLPSDLNGSGIARVSTSTQNDGAIYLNKGLDVVVPGIDILAFGCRVKFESGGGTGASSVTYRMGFMDTYTQADTANGSYLEVPWTGSSAPNIFLKSAKANSRFSYDSGIAANNSDWFKAHVCFNEAGTKASFYINHNFIYTEEDTNYLANTPIGFGIRVVASSTSTTRKGMLIDNARYCIARETYR